MPTIYTINCYLQDKEGGHHYEYLKAISRAAKLNNWHSFQIIPQTCRIDDLDQSWKKVLIEHSYNYRNNFWKQAWQPIRNFKFFLKLADEFKKNQNDQIVFFESYVLSHLIIFFIVLILKFVKPQVWLMHRYDFDKRFLNGRIHKFLHFIFKFFLKKKFKICVDTELLAQNLKNVIKEDSYILPIPHTEYFKKDNVIKKSEYQGWWWPGTIKGDKGVLQAVELAKKISSLESYAHKIQLILPKAFNYFEKDFRNILRLTYVQNLLIKEDYNRLMNSSDLILLPYEQISYKYKSSGIFVEAVYNGSLVVVSDNTWMAYELRKFNLTELIVDWERNDVIEYLYTLSNDKKIQQKFKNIQAHYWDYHSTEQYAKKLKQIFEES